VINKTRSLLSLLHKAKSKRHQKLCWDRWDLKVGKKCQKNCLGSTKTLTKKWG